MEHAVPINKKSFGEHRLGNLVPSCRSCNALKAAKDYRDFLKEKPDRIKIVKKYIESRNCVPLGDNEQVVKILEMAHEEVALVAKRYVSIVNESFPTS